MDMNASRRYRDNLSARPMRTSLSSLCTTSTCSTASGALVSPTSPVHPHFPPVATIRLEEEELEGRRGGFSTPKKPSREDLQSKEDRTPWWAEAPPAKLDKRSKREISTFDVSRMVDTGTFSLSSFAPTADLEDSEVIHMMREAALGESPTLGSAELDEQSPEDGPALKESPTLGSRIVHDVPALEDLRLEETAPGVSKGTIAKDKERGSQVCTDSGGRGYGPETGNAIDKETLNAARVAQLFVDNAFSEGSLEQVQQPSEDEVLADVPTADGSPTMGSGLLLAVAELPQRHHSLLNMVGGPQDMEQGAREEFWSAKRLGKRPMVPADEESIGSVLSSPSRRSSSRPISTSSGSSASSIRSKTSSRSAPSIPSRGSSRGSIIPPATPSRGSSLRDPIHALTTEDCAPAASACRLPLPGPASALTVVLPPPPTRTPYRRTATGSSITSLPTVVEALVEVSPRSETGFTTSPRLYASTSLSSLPHADDHDMGQIFRHRRGASGPVRSQTEDMSRSAVARSRPFLSGSRDNIGSADMGLTSHRHTASLDITPGANGPAPWGTTPLWAGMGTANKARSRFDPAYAYSFPRPAPSPPRPMTPTRSSSGTPRGDTLDRYSYSYLLDEDESDVLTPRPPYSARSEVKMAFPRAEHKIVNQQKPALKPWGQKWRNESPSSAAQLNLVHMLL